MLYTGRHRVWQDKTHETRQEQRPFVCRKSGRKPRKKASPLDIEGVDLGVTTDEIVSMVREGRGRYG